MLKRYTQKQIEKRIAEQEEWMKRLEERYGIPQAYLHAVLLKEMKEIDWMDILADGAVKCYWLRYDLLSWVRRVFKKPPLRRFPGGLLKKRDSSTGYAQIFAYVAIRAMRFSLQKGLEPGPEAFGFSRDHVPDEKDPADLGRVWRRLNGDPQFNLRLAALNLISAAEEMTGRMDFSSFSPEEIQLIFTRYNANARTITDYGRETYQHYLSFSVKAQEDWITKAS